MKLRIFIYAYFLVMFDHSGAILQNFAKFSRVNLPNRKQLLTCKGSELIKSPTVSVIFMGVLDGRSGTLADVPGVGLKD